MWSIKEKDNRHSVDNRHKVAKYYPLQQAAGMRRYGSLINIKPFAFNARFTFAQGFLE